MIPKENEMGIPPTPITTPAPVSTAAVKECLTERESTSLISASNTNSSSSSLNPIRRSRSTLTTCSTSTSSNHATRNEHTFTASSTNNDSTSSKLEDVTCPYPQEKSSAKKKRAFSSFSSFSNSGESDSKECTSLLQSSPPRKKSLPVNQGWDQEYYDSYAPPYRYGESLPRHSQKSNETSTTSSGGVGIVVVPPLPPLNTGSTEVTSSQGHQETQQQQFPPTFRNEDRLVNKRHQQEHQQFHQSMMYPSESGSSNIMSSSTSSSTIDRNAAPNYYQPHQVYLSRNKKSPHMRNIAVPIHPSSSPSKPKVMTEAESRMLKSQFHPGGTAKQNTTSTTTTSARRTNYGGPNTGNTFETSYLGQHQSHTGFNDFHRPPVGGRHSAPRDRSHYHVASSTTSTTSGGYPDMFTSNQGYPTHHVGIPYHSSRTIGNRGINVVRGKDPSSTLSIAPPKLAPYYQRRIVPLSTEDDENWLSEFLCFVRSHCAEVFVASNEDVASRMNSKKVLLDQVGVRCRFCAHLPHRERTGRSSSFPSSLSRIYQSLTMMLRDHFTKCPAMPDHLKERYLCLKANASQGATDSKRYWVESAKSLGLVDTDEGIRYGRSCVKVPHQPPNISS